jgi:hypothetical protein
VIEVDEVAEQRRILLAIAGVRIPGGCDDCHAHVVVHYGVLNAAGDDVTAAPDLTSGVFRLACYHDASCPMYARGLGV